MTDVMQDAVRVKPLNWTSLGGEFYVAKAPLFGNIRIERYSENFSVVWSVPGFCDQFVPGQFKTADLAKAAAMEHYGSCIRSALLPPVPVNSYEEMRAEISRLEDELDDALQAPWPQWAESILKSLKAQGYDPVDTDGTVDLADAFGEYLDGIRQNDEYQQRRISDLEAKLRAALDGAQS